MKVPLLQQDAKHEPLSVMDDTHSSDPQTEGLATFFTSLLALSATEGHLDHPDLHGLRSRRPATPDFATPSGSPEQSTPMGGPEPKSGSEGSVSNGSEFAAGGEGLYDFFVSNQHDNNAPTLRRSEEGILPTHAPLDPGEPNQGPLAGYSA